MKGAVIQRTEEDNLEIIGKKEERTDKAIYRYELKRRKELIHQLMEGFHRRDRLCDLGCSNGWFFDFFKQEGFKEVHGVELYPVRAELARKRGYDSVYLGKGQNTPFPNNYFDVVVNQEVLVHVLRYKDRIAMIREAYRILKPGGLYILTFPSTDGKKTIEFVNRVFLIPFFKRIKDKVLKKERGVDPSIYCRFWSGKEMKCMLAESGFTIIKTLGHLYYYPEIIYLCTPLLWIFDRLFCKLLPYRGKTTFVCSTKTKSA